MTNSRKKNQYDIMAFLSFLKMHQTRVRYDKAEDGPTQWHYTPFSMDDVIKLAKYHWKELFNESEIASRLGPLTKKFLSANFIKHTGDFTLSKRKHLRSKPLPLFIFNDWEQAIKARLEADAKKVNVK